MRRPKRNTRQSIRRLIEFDPTISNALIASTLGLSKQLVSYHTRHLYLPRYTERKQCAICHVRISRKSKTGMCRPCWVESHAYEFSCGWCGAVRVVYGRKATVRRHGASGKVSGLDFCDLSCSGKHSAQKAMVASSGRPLGAIQARA